MKVLQSLYAFVQSGNTDLAAGEKELFFGIEKIYDLYLHQFMLLDALLQQAGRQIEENRVKRLPSQQDLHPNTRFVDNECLRMIAASPSLASQARERNIGWENEQELVRRLLLHIQQQAYYREYMQQEAGGYLADREWVIRMVKKDLMHFERLHHYYEEKSIYWLDDWELVNKMLIKTLLNSTGEDGAKLSLMPLYKEEEDKEFARALFGRTVLNMKSLDPVIAAKTENWEVERIALMDILIMKMAVTEILHFEEIPLRVSLNEYIELSKMYSTPKSKMFVNGVLDKLVEEFVSQNKISKEGRTND